MTSTDTTTLEEQIAPVAAELADVQDRIKNLTEIADGLKAKLRDLRFNPDAFATAYPVTTNPQFYKLTPDAAAIKAKVAPEVYESFMRQVGDVKVGLS